MKVYFAGSIRGGRVDAGLYHRMIVHIQKTDTVLTEHVGDLRLQESTTDTEIYAQDTEWLQMSELLIAECTCPSLGVGYELAYAESKGVPCHIFYDRNKTELSAMLTGDPYFVIHPYEKEEEIYPVLDAVLAEMRGKVKQKRIVRVQEMEGRLNRLKSWLMEKTGSIQEEVRVLDAYFQSPLWRLDYEADEDGELPSDLPRGVLSEDALYNALTEYDEVAEGENESL